MKKAGLTVVLVLAAALGAFAQKSPGDFYPYSFPSYYEANNAENTQGERYDQPRHFSYRQN